MSTQDHWESVYASRTDQELSWTQPDPHLSLSLIAEVCPAGSVIDVGAGTSSLPAKLLDRGYSVTVLDISAAAVTRGRERLGPRASMLQWIVADVTAGPGLGSFDLWHDRAVFHFLTNPADRAAYIALLERTLAVGRHAVIATFALDGPEKCSGLRVERYSGQTLHAELGAGFELLKTVPELHVTPQGNTQSFQYSVFRRVSGESGRRLLNSL
ncbi:MAG TPA: class I SAM-dependent methyltransferase [Bryobacteraceae bacterium]|jgi:SAM-dependent methyltransferase|nr:class I SAM-dependent methyltransferase [Bryobacteraceae bacterium]